MSVAEIPEQGYRLLVKLHAAENLTANMTRLGMLKDSGDVWEHLFAREDIVHVVIAWLGETQDARGNADTRPVLRVGFSRDSWEQTRWEAISMDDRAKTAADEYEELVTF